MKKIHVNLGKNSYDIVIGKDAMSQLKPIIDKIAPSAPVVIITDKNVYKNLELEVAALLKSIKKRFVLIININPGERSKSLKTFQAIADKILAQTKKHKPVIVAFGGGVVGDLAGFVAATYRRGVPIVQVPTTLLSQVDSSIGGKVGIDLPEAKNILGAFKQPSAVLIDPSLLKTLPKKQIRNGLGEVIKYGIIKDRILFDYLEKNMTKIFSNDIAVLENIIFKCALIKARIVEKDEFDVKDLRIILNFGHTLGHAIESASGYSKNYNHGESVSFGMLMASKIAVGLGLLSQANLNRIAFLIEKAGLPTKVKGLKESQVMSFLQNDKKFINGTNRFVLPTAIGKIKIVEGIGEKKILEVYKYYAD
ncbi:MAG: 3-dehydroquinate synthase [Candidatus Omnitrophica bacterium]|nr:3-dehydroquinate synthase [Candidatus Omnitrophota bacterium]